MNSKNSIAEVNEGLINRELSWLDFNNRVLEEALDGQTPLLERLKFVAIASSNLDEFFMVRVAGLRQQLLSGVASTDPSGMTVEEQLTAINKKVESMLRRQYRCLQNEILPALEKQGVFRLTAPSQLRRSEYTALKDYFQREIMPMLTPVAVDPSHPFPIIANCMLEIAVLLRKPDGKGWHRGLVEVPGALPRWLPVEIETDRETRLFVTLEDTIIEFLDQLFVNRPIEAAFPFRLTRDMDFSADTDGVVDLLQHVRQELRRRRLRQPIRLELPRGSDRRLGDWLIKQLQTDRLFVYRLPGPMALNDFFQMLEHDFSPSLREPDWPPLESPFIKENESIFTAVSRHRHLPLFPPYEQFDPVIQLLEEAAADQHVLAIKQTLYRVSGDSPVVRALRRAAESGKQVTVILELKARFDEERNIGWARHLEEAGVHVIYGMAGLKVHSKMLMIVRREGSHIRRYLHLSTGNYNDSTARLYTDASIFTNDSVLCSDAAALFNVMTGYSDPPAWEQLAVAPYTLRTRFLELIERETRLSSARNPGSIRVKINTLVDPEIINALFRAARAGVKIEMAVRGACCMRPGGLIDNIRVVSIVDRFLEHTRMFRFGNGGKLEYYMASADWMPRNLDRRIETLFPVYDRRICRIIDHLFELQLQDRCKGRRLRADGTFAPPSRSSRWRHTRSQRRTYEFFQDCLAGETKGSYGK